VSAPDAVVIGAGPNGLAAALALAEAGRSVTVLEAAETVGGGARSAELTLPGFTHDICSAVHPLAAASPFFRRLPLARFGLEWITPPAALAHPFDGGAAVLLWRSLGQTASGLGADGASYQALMERLGGIWPRIEQAVLGPLAWPRHPAALAQFGWLALQPAIRLVRAKFKTEQARALFGGIAAHGMLPLDRPLTAAFALVLAVAAHRWGWPLPRGGAQRIASALAACLRAFGGAIVTGARVYSLDDAPRCRALLCDLSPRPFLAIAGRRLAGGYRRRLERYRYGPGVFKIDWALEAPIPWRAAECALAAAVHLGGTLEEIARTLDDVWSGRTPERPFVVLSQPTLFDPSRAPSGRHIAWAYCHVPNGSEADMLERVESQVERFAPGFRARILARHVMAPADLERHNPNFSGGDIASGAMDLRQAFLRPTRLAYRTPVRGLYLCSAATPPGPGVHGMCGWFAARRALAEALRQ
jgi:phytoene dehydrogenase-like protein